MPLSLPLVQYPSPRQSTVWSIYCVQKKPLKTEITQTSQAKEKVSIGRVPLPLPLVQYPSHTQYEGQVVHCPIYIINRSDYIKQSLSQDPDGLLFAERGRGDAATEGDSAEGRRGQSFTTLTYEIVTQNALRKCVKTKKLFY